MGRWLQGADRILRLFSVPELARMKRPVAADRWAAARNFARKFVKHDRRAQMLSYEKIFPPAPAGNSKNDVVWADSVDIVPPQSQVSKSVVWGGIT